MAIAFNALTEGLVGPGVTSHTLSHTTAGSDRILWVGVLVTAGDVITGVTYAGVAMTQANKVMPTGLTQFTYLYYLIAPASGANNVVVSTSVGGYIRTHAASYTGARQSGVPDASNTGTVATPTTSLTVSVTTVADNCWTVMEASTQSVTLSAGTGSTIRSTVDDSAFFDSNGPKTPAGSTSMAVTASAAPTGGIGACMASFAPSVAAAAVNTIDFGHFA